jgi:hypothetical protein
MTQPHPMHILYSGVLRVVGSVFAALGSVVLMGADCVQCGSMYVQCLFAPTCIFLFYVAFFLPGGSNVILS